MRISDWSSDVCSSDLNIGCLKADTSTTASMVDLAIINNFATDDKRYTEGISHGLSHIVRSEGNAGTLFYASNTPAPNRARIWRSTKSASHIINHRSFSLPFETVLEPEERRLGKECFSMCSTRLAPYNK